MAKWIIVLTLALMAKDFALAKPNFTKVGKEMTSLNVNKYS